MVTPHQKVRGLTTAAGLWAVACLGINIGVGNYVIALGVFAAMSVTMFVADKLEVIFFRHLCRIHVTVLMQSLEIVSEIRDKTKVLDVTLSNLEFTEAVGNKGITLTCFLWLKHRTHHQTAIDLSESVPGVLYVESCPIGQLFL